MTQTIKELQEALEAAEAALAWERKIPELLLSLGYEFQRAEDARQVYVSALAGVHDRLDWDEGQAFVVAESNEAQAAVPLWQHVGSMGVQGESCGANGAPSAIILELVSRAAQTGEPAWNPEMALGIGSRGKQASDEHGPTLAVALPIKLTGRVVAVLVFCSRRVISQEASIQRFFDLLAEKIGATIELQDSIRREREHTIALLNASKMSALGEVAAGIAHEIRNPLSAISTLCQVVRRMVVANPINVGILIEQIGRIERSLERVTSIISDLQGFSRDASRDPFVETSLREVVGQTLTLCRARFMKDRIALQIDEIPSDWSVECRPSQVSQVLLNLLGNAHDAALGMPGGWVKVEARDQGDSYELAVSNSGPPIPLHIADRVMDAFFTTKPPGKGTGLGLSISSSIAKGHNGNLRLDRNSPTPRFVLVLPKQQEPLVTTQESAA